MGFAGTRRPACGRPPSGTRRPATWLIHVSGCNLREPCQTAEKSRFAPGRGSNRDFSAVSCRTRWRGENGPNFAAASLRLSHERLMIRAPVSRDSDGQATYAYRHRLGQQVVWFRRRCGRERRGRTAIRSEPVRISAAHMNANANASSLVDCRIAKKSPLQLVVGDGPIAGGNAGKVWIPRNFVTQILTRYELRFMIFAGQRFEI